MMDGTKGGEQRAHSLRPRCYREVDPETVAHIYLFIYLSMSIFTTYVGCTSILTLTNPIFLPPAYSPALIYCGLERGWLVNCHYPTVLKEKNRNRTSDIMIFLFPTLFLM
jgi:hypothetical protein